MPKSFRVRKPNEFEELRRDDSAYLLCRPGDPWSPEDDLAEHFYHEAQAAMVAVFTVDHWALWHFQAAPRHDTRVDMDAKVLHVNVYHQEADLAGTVCQTCGARLHAAPVGNKFRGL